MPGNWTPSGVFFYVIIRILWGECDMHIVSENESKQKQIGECIGKNISQKTIILLDGPLGAGKTTLTKGIGLGIGISDPINSPTFTIAKQYSGEKVLNHLDVYRLEGLDEDIGIEDYVYDEEVLVIEWSKFIDSSVFDEYLHIQIDYEEDHRILTFKPVGEYHTELVEKVLRCII